MIDLIIKNKNEVLSEFYTIVVKAYYDFDRKNEVDLKNNVISYQVNPNLIAGDVETVLNELEEIKENESSDFSYEKADLMSRAEIREFAINSIAPYIVKELELPQGCIFKAPEDHSADIYVKQGNQITGILFRVSVAPNKRHFVDFERSNSPIESNNKFTLDMEAKGYKCAYADVSIGARDALKFDRRVVLKNDAYYFNYEELDYPKVKANGYDIRYSLSPGPSEEERSKAVYSEYVPERKTPNSAFMVQRPEPTVENKPKEIKPSSPEVFHDLIEAYNIQNLNVENLKDYLYILYNAIDGAVDERNLVLTFFNCVDFCNGLFLADSEAVPEEKIIPTCLDLISTNTSYYVSRHKEFVIAHYIYNYLTNNYTVSIASVDEMHKKRIALFEYSPRLFGFTELKGEKDKIEAEANKVVKRKDILENKIPRFIELYKYYDSICENNSDNTTEYRVTLAELKEIGEEAKSDFFKYLLHDEEIEDKVAAMYSLIFLLEKEIEILQKTNSGKYGFMEKRKDQKEKAEKVARYKDWLKKCNL